MLPVELAVSYQEACLLDQTVGVVSLFYACEDGHQWEPWYWYTHMDCLVASQSQRNMEVRVPGYRSSTSALLEYIISELSPSLLDLL